MVLIRTCLPNLIIFRAIIPLQSHVSSTASFEPEFPASPQSVAFTGDRNMQLHSPYVRFIVYDKL